MKAPARDVILNAGEASVKDPTSLSGHDAVNGTMA